MSGREWESVAATHVWPLPSLVEAGSRDLGPWPCYRPATPAPQRPEPDRSPIGRCCRTPPDAPEPPAVPQNFLAYLFRVVFPKQPAEPAGLACGRLPRCARSYQPGSHLPFPFSPCCGT